MAEEYLKLVEALRKGLGGDFLNYEYNVKRRTLKLFIERSALTKAIELVNEICNGEYHVTTITGADLGGDEIELTYFLWLLPQRLRVAIKIKAPKKDLKVQSLVGVAPATILYEREVYEMLGVIFEGHPKLEKLFLPEDWPKDVYPLRRE